MSRKLSINLWLAAIFLCGAFGAYAQDADHTWATPGGSVVTGGMGLCLNAQGYAIPSGPNCVGATITKMGVYTNTGAQYAVSINSATTLSVPPGSLAAEICVETQAARYTDDGTTPTTSTGIPVSAGSCFQYAGPLSAFKIIGQAAGGTIDVSYYK